MSDPSRRMVGYYNPASALLLHFDAVNPGGGDAHYFIDSSRYNHIIARTNNNVGISNAYKFPPGSLVNPANFGKVFWRVHKGLNMEADFTFDFWFFASSLGNWSDPQGGSSFGINLAYDNWLDGYAYKNNVLQIFIEDLGSNLAGIGTLWCLFNDLNGNILGNATGHVITQGAWHHVAFVKAGSLHSFYYNGQLVEDWTADTNFTAFWWLPPFEANNLDPAYNPEHNISVLSSPTINKPIYIDEVHLEPKALWNGPFDLPTSPYSG